MVHSWRRAAFTFISALIIGAGFLVTLATSRALACDPEYSPTNDHCYARAQWNVTGEYAQGFLGAKADITTSDYSLGNTNHTDFMTDEMWVAFDGGDNWVEGGDVTGNFNLGSQAGYGVNPHYFWANQRPCCGFWGWTWGLVSSYPIPVQIWSAGNPAPDPSQGPTWYVKVAGNNATGYPEEWAWSNRIATGLETVANGNINEYDISNMQWESLTKGDWNFGWWSNYPSHAVLVVKGPDSSSLCDSWVKAYSHMQGGQNVCGFTGSPINTSSSSSSTAATAATTTTTSTSTGVTAPDDSQLRADAVQAATTMGDSDPSGITRVDGVDEQTVASVLAQSDAISGAAGRQVDVVTETGNFTGSDLPIPDGSPAPTGTQLTLVIDQSTGEVVGVGLDNNRPALSQLGQPATLQ